MSDKKKLRYKLYLLIALPIIIIAAVLAANINKNNQSNAEKSSPIKTEIEDNMLEENITETEESKEENTATAKITAVGDIIFHQDQLTSAYDSSTGKYDFNDSFKYIKNYIESSDLSIATCETTFAGEEYTYSGYPLFNTPVEALDSLKNAGFDMLSLASNHILDVTTPGFYNTMSAVKENGFDMLGLRENESDKNYIVKDINGIKIGFTSYCYETANISGQRTLNSIPIPGSIVNLVNSFGSSTLDNDLSLMSQTVENMKADGAEFIIFVMHWGDEYSTEYSAYQNQIASELNSYGVDVILGSHPHVVQPLEMIKNSSTGKETLVFYSLGNFLSNQRLETMGNSLSASGALANLEIEKDSDGNVSLKSYNYIPTWVYKYNDSNNLLKYNILPVKDVLDSSLKLDLPQDVLDEIQDSYNSTTSIIGQVN